MFFFLIYLKGNIMPIIKQLKEAQDVQLQEKSLSKIMNKDKIIWEPKAIVVETPPVSYTLTGMDLFSDGSNPLIYQLEYFDNNNDTFEVKTPENEYYKVSLTGATLTVTGKKTTRNATNDERKITIWQRNSKGELTNEWVGWCTIEDHRPMCDRLGSGIDSTYKLPRLQLPSGQPLTYDITTDTLVTYNTPSSAQALGLPATFSYYIQYSVYNNHLKVRYNGEFPIGTRDPKQPSTVWDDLVYNIFYFPLTTEDSSSDYTLCNLYDFQAGLPNNGAYETGQNLISFTRFYSAIAWQNRAVSAYMDKMTNTPYEHRDPDTYDSSTWTTTGAYWSNASTDNQLSTGKLGTLSSTYKTYGFYIEPSFEHPYQIGKTTNTSKYYINSKKFMRFSVSDFNTPWFCRYAVCLRRARKSRSKPLIIDIYVSTSDFMDNSNRYVNTIASGKTYIYPRNYVQYLSES